jgi:hypothetical protein
MRWQPGQRSRPPGTGEGATGIAAFQGGRRGYRPATTIAKKAMIIITTKARSKRTP